ncbi:MAG: immunoglobulin domain-containing protein, partial [Bacteroidetes bacterium]|nr:immunoglobulin domain-containing protein [Bacteroidota bacterium]
MKRFIVLIAWVGCFVYNANAACPVTPGSITTSDATICSGTNPGTISATASSGGNGSLFYAWLFSTDNGANWNAAPGTNNAQNYSIPAVLTSTTWYKRTTFDGGGCTQQETSPVKFTVTPQTTIGTNPTNQTGCEGNNVSFSVTASSGHGLTYQWQEDKGSGFANLANGGNYFNVTLSSMLVINLSSSMNGYKYRCVVSSTACNDETSNEATLTVQTAPSITTQPSNQTECNGNDATFSLTATGTGLTYQWQEDNGGGFSNLSNGGSYSGVTSTSLTVTAATALNGYDYRCVVSGTCTPSVNSNSASLTVNELPSISVNPSDDTECEGGNAAFSVTASGTGLTYQWQENNGGGFSNISNGGIYGGATSANLTLTAITAGMDGYDYRCVVSGTCTPSVTSSSANLTVNTSPSISTHPSSDAICETANTSFSVTATGTGLTYQWQEDDGGGYSNLANGGIYGGVTTATLSITSATTGEDGYKYRVVVSGTCTPAVTSNEATLTVQDAPAITAQPSDDTECAGGNASFSVTATGTSLTYQWQEDSGSGFANISNGGVYSGATTTSLTLTSVTTGMNGYDYRCVVDNSECASVTSNSVNLT